MLRRDRRPGRPRLLVVLYIVPPYRAALLEKLARRGRVEVCTMTEARGEANRTWPQGLRSTWVRYIQGDSWSVDLHRIGADGYLHLPKHPHRVARTVRQFDPDVVVAAGSGNWSSPVNIGLWLWRLVCRPRWKLALLWGSWRTVLPRRSQSRQRYRARDAVRMLLSPWVRAFVRHADAWIAYGSKAKNEVQALGAISSRTIIVPNAVADESAVGEKAAEPDNRPVFLFVGRLMWEKGIDTVLEAFERNETGTLWICGEGPLAPDVERAALANDSIQWLGHVEGEELAARYRACDAVLLPARYEVWGLVVNEAVMFGKPVVVSENVGAAYDIVEPERTGLIVSAGDAAELANALNRIATWSPEQYAACRSRCDAIHSRWNLDIAAARLEALVLDLASEKPLPVNSVDAGGHAS